MDFTGRGEISCTGDGGVDVVQPPPPPQRQTQYNTTRTMPAKGWRKDEQETNIDTVMHNENLSIDAFAFPKSIINKLSKQALAEADPNSRFLFAKDSQTIIQRACILYINFIYHHAKQLVKKQNRKVVNADDVINALAQVGFQEFEGILRNELASFERKKEAKKLARATAKANANSNAGNVEDATVEESNPAVTKRIKLQDLVSPNGQPMNLDDEEDEAERVEDLEEAEEEEEDDEEDIGDEEQHVDEDAPHKPSQFELEQKELAGEDPDRIEVSQSDVIHSVVETNGKTDAEVEAEAEAEVDIDN